jgi:threonine dehydrogenase-like Zn-dependent dehydrogenase
MLLAVAELGLFAVALPARYAQLAAPDQAVRAELAVLGLSPGMYAFYQVALDTIFDLTLPLDQVAEGYAAMDERGAIKTLLRP